MSKFESHLLYEEYNFEDDSRLARRQKSKNGRLPSHTPQASDVADLIGLEGGLDISYQPSRHESGWLIDSLRSFFDLELISDVQALIKGGKEANVYRCAAHEVTGERWLAAKVYRPRMFRNLRNDKQYRQGRVTLTTTGRPLDGRDTRAIRALGKKTAFGQQLAHTSWLMHEYTTLELLHEAGAAVPRPIAAATNAILMSFVGDQHLAAPTLNEISLDPVEAERLFGVVMQNIGLMLANGRIHGDLSAYNILYWQGGVTLIDFPQVSNSQVDGGVHELGSRMNPDAYNILGRDVERVCDYFSRFGVNCDPALLTHNLWQRHTHISQRNQLADASLYLDD